MLLELPELEVVEVDSESLRLEFAELDEPEEIDLLTPELDDAPEPELELTELLDEDCEDSETLALEELEMFFDRLLLVCSYSTV
jgi:hypothetical protein